MRCHAAEKLPHLILTKELDDTNPSTAIFVFFIFFHRVPRRSIKSNKFVSRGEVYFCFFLVSVPLQQRSFNKMAPELETSQAVTTRNLFCTTGQVKPIQK